MEKRLPLTYKPIEYRFLDDWEDVEEMQKIILPIFSKWEKENLIITNGTRDYNVEMTYGFPYTPDFANLWNCNVTAELKSEQDYRFQFLAVTRDDEIVAGFHHKETQESKGIVIGYLDSIIAKTHAERRDILEHLVAAFQRTRHGKCLISAEYEASTERVYLVCTYGVKPVNVTADSGIAFISDVTMNLYSWIQ